ncbi:MAG TPA: exonuclease SbcCD subunit D [Lachnospiraceae bacterium]|nr:exonuclease SbcCD subunit D [Lachnospiraceae bacterium]
MKIFHLSDLHLGKRVNEFSMLEDQEYILTEIIRAADEERPEAVVIAGDVYDKAVPSAEAVELFDRFLVRLSKRGIRTFVISGNHDSPERIAFGGRLMDASGIHMSPVYHADVQPVTLTDEFGKVNFYMLPFVKPANVRRFFPDEELATYTEALRRAVAEIRGDRGEEAGNPEPAPAEMEQGDLAPEPAPAETEPGELAPEPAPVENALSESAALTFRNDERNVLIAHQFVTGASRSESEEISVGGTDNVDASVFDGFDYVALGHIHGPQNVGRETLRYCGTPLKYSFSEAGQVKSITVVRMGPKGTTEVSTLPLVPRHDLREIKGRYMDITAKAFYEGTRTDDYLHITLTDEEDILDAVGKLRTIYPNLMKLDYDNARTRSGGDFTVSEKMETLSPLSLFEEFYEKQNNRPMTEEQRAFVEELMNGMASM